MLTELVETAGQVRRAVFKLLPKFVSEDDAERSLDLVTSSVGLATGFVGKPPNFEEPATEVDERPEPETKPASPPPPPPPPPPAAPGRRRL